MKPGRIICAGAMDRERWGLEIEGLVVARGRWWEKGLGTRKQAIIAMEKCMFLHACGLCFVFGGEDGGGNGTASSSLSLPKHTHTVL